MYITNQNNLNDDVIDVKSVPCSYDKKESNSIKSSANNSTKESNNQSTSTLPIVLNVNVNSNNPSTFQANKNTETLSPVDYYNNSESPVFTPNVVTPVITQDEKLKQVYNNLIAERKTNTTQAQETEYIKTSRTISDNAKTKKTIKCAETFYPEFI